MNAEDKVFYVYLHLKDNDFYEVFYVGLGSSYKRYKTKSSRNTVWKNYVKKYGLVTKIVAENLTLEEARKLEQFYIKEFGRLDKGLGPLVNLTDGGEGTRGYSGHKLSAETRAKMSASRTGKSVPGLIGKKQTPEAIKARMEAIKKFYKDNPGFRKTVITDEFRRKCSERMRSKTPFFLGGKHTDETKRKISEFWKERRKTKPLKTAEETKTRVIFRKLITGEVKRSKKLEKLLGTVMYIKEQCAKLNKNENSYSY